MSSGRDEQKRDELCLILGEDFHFDRNPLSWNICQIDSNSLLRHHHCEIGLHIFLSCLRSYNYKTSHLYNTNSYLIIFDTILSLTESEAPELTWKQWIIHCLSTSLVVASQRCQLLPHKYVNHRAVNHLLPHTSVNSLPHKDVNLLPHISLNLLPPKDVNHCRVAALSLRLLTICSTAVALQVCSAINEEVNLMPILLGWVGTG